MGVEADDDYVDERQKGIPYQNSTLRVLVNSNWRVVRLKTGKE